MTVNISIIGTGNIGGSLGRAWGQQGHTVSYGSRHPASTEVQALVSASGSQASAGSVAKAITAGDIIVFAIPGAAMPETIRQHAAALAGKTVIDATNLIGPQGATSALAHFAEHAPSAQVYRAFNSLGYENIDNPRYGDLQADLFYCGPEGAARERIAQLIADAGFNPVYVGDNSLIHLVDALGGLWITLVFRRGMGRRLAFKLLTR